jgi:hypothetical protein
MVSGSAFWDGETTMGWASEDADAMAASIENEHDIKTRITLAPADFKVFMVAPLFIKDGPARLPCIIRFPCVAPRITVRTVANRMDQTKFIRLNALKSYERHLMTDER